jgi:hypothetical protein
LPIVKKSATEGDLIYKQKSLRAVCNSLLFVAIVIFVGDV